MLGPESALELEICYHLKSKGFTVIKIPTAGYFDAKIKKFRKQTSPFALNGLPDLMVLHKALEGRWIGLEVKTKTGRQTESQELMEGILVRLGCFYRVVRSIEDAEKACREALGLGV